MSLSSETSHFKLLPFASGSLAWFPGRITTVPNQLVVTDVMNPCICVHVCHISGNHREFTCMYPLMLINEPKKLPKDVHMYAFFLYKLLELFQLAISLVYKMVLYTV